MRRDLRIMAEEGTTRRPRLDAQRNRERVLGAAREAFAGALRHLLEAGAADGTLRSDLRAEDLVTAIVGVVSATAVAGGREQLERLFDLVLEGARGHAGRHEA